MTTKDFTRIIELTKVHGGFLPANDNARELEDSSANGEVLSFTEVTARDIKMHRCYFSLLNFIYGYMPDKFKRTIPEKHFYRFLQHLTGTYTVIFEFKDGSKLLEYESISFGRMSQKTFEAYVKNQLPGIYEHLIRRYFSEEISKGIIETIEEQYERFLSKL